MTKQFFNQKLLKNSLGYTLPSVMISTAIMMVAMLAITNFLTAHTQNMAFLEDKLSRIDFENHIRQTLMEPQACEETLRGVRPPKIAADPVNPGTDVTAITHISDANAKRLYDLSSSVKYDQLNITAARLVNINHTNVGAAITGTVRLDFGIQRVRAGGGSSSLRNVSVNVFAYDHDADGGIDDCHLEGYPPGSTGGPQGGSCTDLPPYCLNPTPFATISGDPNTDYFWPAGETECQQAAPFNQGTIFSAVTGNTNVKGCWKSKVHTVVCISGSWVTTSVVPSQGASPAFQSIAPSITNMGDNCGGMY